MPAAGSRSADEDAGRGGRSLWPDERVIDPGRSEVGAPHGTGAGWTTPFGIGSHGTAIRVADGHVGEFGQWDRGAGRPRRVGQRPVSMLSTAISRTNTTNSITVAQINRRATRLASGVIRRHMRSMYQRHNRYRPQRCQPAR